MRQRQFLNVLDEGEAHHLFDEACAHLPQRSELVLLDVALHRVLAADVTAAVDVPAFDRSNMDGFAVRAADTFGAEELEPVVLAVADLTLAAGQAPPTDFEVTPGEAVPIATGGVVPRGADAVVMVEHTEPDPAGIRVSRPAVPGGNITFAGSDIGRGEVVMRRGTRLTATPSTSRLRMSDRAPDQLRPLDIQLDAAPYAEGSCIIAANPEQAAQVEAKPKTLGWFVGQVMKATEGKANPQAVNEILRRKLGVTDG